MNNLSFFGFGGFYGLERPEKKNPGKKNTTAQSKPER